MLKHKQFPLFLYSVVWSLYVGYFWLFVHGDALGYAVLVFWVLLPLTAFFASLLMGLYQKRSRKNWLFPLIPALGHLLADYFTFKLANSISHHKLNAPDWTLLLPGLVCGLAGVIFGQIISNHSQKEQFKNPHQMQ